MKTLATFSLLLFLAGSQVQAQHSSNAYRVLADSLYRHHHYQYAAEYYEKAIKKAPDPGYLMLQLGKSYDKINNAPQAERWFRLASLNKARFSDEDYYLYAEALIAQEKRAKADSLLRRILVANPNMLLARQSLHDLQNYSRFYKDTAIYKVKSLSTNTHVAEFSPAYYKEGIVFSAARQEGALKKKYHWDNSHYLNLYFTTSKDGKFKEPELFEKDLNTRHHDGPAVFYDQYRKMILNRNQRVEVEGREDVFELRPGLFDASFNEGRSTWDVSPLPFNNSNYSYAHPAVSEDGNTLYFTSDMPGGYGGMDLYRIERSKGTWGVPFNLGPNVNTMEDEVFPFFVNNTLYFSSNGHGGLGGLDVFYSETTANGFAPVENMGFPINSHADDFSFITDSIKTDGYYASARNGNDDIFSFHKSEPKVKLLAHIYDGESRNALPAANIQIITNGSNDQTLSSDERGNFEFVLPREEAFIAIGTKDDLIGMTSDLADSNGKKIEIAAYRDTTTVLCVGLIKNETGVAEVASEITISDETAGQQLIHPGGLSIITFRGEKGHRYQVTATNLAGNTAQHDLEISSSDQGVKKFTIILPSASRKLEMAARVFRADDNTVIPDAQVQIITFDDNDQELISNQDGVVEFSLDHGTAYVVIANKAGLSGMHSGMAENGTDKATIIHPVPAYGDKDKNVLAMGLVTNRTGKPVEGYTAEVTNQTTGEKVTVQSNKGLLTFLGERGVTYNVNVMHDDFQTSMQEVQIPADRSEPKKFSVILEHKAGEETDIRPVVTPVIAQNIKPSTLVVLDTENGKPKAFLAENHSLKEITEQNGELYLQNKDSRKSLGKGSISDLKKADAKALSRLGLGNSGSVSLRNIYFDFDKASLDEEDKQRLALVKQVLDSYDVYTLTVAGHADDRGTDNYNVRLSRKRSNAVTRYLIDQGVPKSKINQRALGETQPAIPCNTGNCSEDDHKLNRRAEFVIEQKTESTLLVSVPDVKSTSGSVSANFVSTVKSYGERQVDGVLFKINIGAYKRNHSLSFRELADLGTVESIKKDGVTYYSLSEYHTLNEAEKVREQVEQRGVKGTTITIYQKGEKIKLSQFISQLQ